MEEGARTGADPSTAAFTQFSDAGGGHRGRGPAKRLAAVSRVLHFTGYMGLLGVGP